MTGRKRSVIGRHSPQGHGGGTIPSLLGLA